jgi:hypothetical protein
MIQFVSLLATVSNFVTMAIGIWIFVKVDLPSTPQEAFGFVTIAILNLAYIARHLNQIRSGRALETLTNEEAEDD